MPSNRPAAQQGTFAHFDSLSVPSLASGLRPLFLPDLLSDAAAQVNQIYPRERDAAHAVFLKWIGHLESGMLDAHTETQVEHEFYKELLGSLGYKTFNDVPSGQPWNMEVKWSEEGADKPDASMGTFQLDDSSELTGEPLVVAELKGAATRDLDRKVRGRSPVQQAWGYLVDSETAKWAVVSNIREFRLYSRERPTRYVYRVFLQDLKERAAFSEFYAVFHAPGLLQFGSLSLNATRLLHDTGERQESVGDALYKQYAENRTALIREILRKRDVTLDQAIQTAQRLLDRIIFICFAQARGLLTDRRILQKVYDTRLPGVSRWMALQFLFRAIDKGDDNGMPRYNGNLFKPDDILDDLSFQLDSSRWPAVFRDFGSYDYNNEVTVDVLGRIFERSITDVEEIKAKGLDKHEQTLATRARASSRRRQFGIYYTAAYIVEFLTHAALDPLRAEAEARIRGELGIEGEMPEPPPAEFTRGMLAWLDSTKVCDTACGSGAFLTAYYNWFEDARIDLLTDLQRAEPDAPECRNEKNQPGIPADWRASSSQLILRNNIFGVDISPESVEIAQLALWIRTAHRDNPLTDLSTNIVCGNSVVQDWTTLFPQFPAGVSFSAVVGNPPYLSGAKIPYRNQLRGYCSFNSDADLYVYFYERGLTLLEPGGRLAFISSGTFIKSAFGEGLRDFIASEASLESYIDFGEYQPFPEAEIVRPSCVVIRNVRDGEKVRMLKYLCGEEPERDLTRALLDYGSDIDRPKQGEPDWQLEKPQVKALVRKLQGTGQRLTAYCGLPIRRGIISGLTAAFNITDETRKSLVERDANSRRVIKRFYDGEDLRPWYQDDSLKYIIMLPCGITRKSCGDDVTEAQGWKWLQRTYPGIAAHLKPFEAKARRRQDQGHFWWELRACDYYDEFGSAKVVWPDIAKLPRASMDTEQGFFSNTAYFIPRDDFFLLGVLNSSAIWFVISKTAQPLRLRGGRWQYRCFQQFMEALPIPDAQAPQRDAIAELSRTIDAAAKERYQLEEKVRRRFVQSFSSALVEPRFSVRLYNWPVLTLTELGPELQRVFRMPLNPWNNPSLVDSWEPYLTERYGEHAALSDKIADAAREIDGHIYRLFGLSRTEINILEEQIEPCPGEESDQQDISEEA